MSDKPTSTAPIASERASFVYQQAFSVSYSYPIHFTEHLFDPNNPVLRETVTRIETNRRHRCLCFVDDGIVAQRGSIVSEIKAYADAHADVMTLVVDPLPVPGGEKIKNELFHVEWMQGLIQDYGIDRHSFVIAVGGGAVLDAVGLVAATAHRGIRLIRIPTTVLSQNDSGVGVKNSVNLKGSKNFVGTFAPPFAVLNDYDFIRDLPVREKIAGMAEAVKVALIRDRAFFTWLEQNIDALTLFQPEAMRYMIRRCAELHARQIAHGGDPFETGSARPLDFGHWAAHKIESLTRNHVRHGEAVAIGIALDTRYSVLAGLLAAGTEDRVAALLELLGFNLWHPVVATRAPDGSHPLLRGLQEFREHLGGELTITLLSEIGRGQEVHEMDEGNVLESIAWLQARRRQP